MSVTVDPLDDADEWNSFVEQAEQSTPFHRWESLSVFAEHSGATLHPLAGYKGQEPVGLFPVFTMSKGPVTAAFSPPPDLKVHYLGPLQLNFRKLKRRKRDRRNRRFVEATVEWPDDAFSPRYTNLRTPVGYDDARPFTWNGYDVAPRYTYVIDLSRDLDDLLAAFSSDARKNIQGEYDVDYDIYEGGTDAIERVMEQVQARHDEQGEPFPVDAAFVTDLYERLPEGVVRPYVCTVEGEFAGGIVNLEFDGTAYAWLGGAKPRSDLPVNDLIDWRLCQDTVERGTTAYDLVGANNERLCKYKAKFAPDLELYYRVQKGTTGMNVASKLYRRFR